MAQEIKLNLDFFKTSGQSAATAYVSTKYSVIEPWSEETYDELYDAGYDGTSSATSHR